MSDKEQQGDLYRLIQLGRTPGKSVPMQHPFLTHEEAQKFYEIRRTFVPPVRVIGSEDITAEAVNDIIGKGSFVAMPDSWPGLSIRQDVSPMLMVDGVGKVDFRGVSIVDTFEKDEIKITAERVQEIDYSEGHQHVMQVAAAKFDLPPGLREIMTRSETAFATSVVNSCKRWSDVFAKVSPVMQEAMQKYAEHVSGNFFKRDIYLSIRKEVYGMKPKRVLPSGSMRKRRRHYYSDLIKKNVEVEGKLLKNAYPTNAPIMSEASEDGMVSVTMSFAFDKADEVVKAG